MTRKQIQFVASLLVTAGCLYLAFRNVPLKQLWGELRQINYWWGIPFCAITLVGMYIRAVRWKYLLEPVLRAPSHKLFSPLIICFALNGILPGRAGEFARAYLVSRDYRVKFSSAFGTVVVERIADGISLLALFMVILAFVPLAGSVDLEWGKTKWVIDAAQLRALTHRLVIVSAILVAGTILMLWGPFRRLVQRIVRRIPLLPHKWKDSLNRFIETFVQGFHSLRSPRLILWVIIYTALVWLSVGWSLAIMSYGFSGVHMSLLQGMATAIIICIAILIPAAPGYWGLYEVGCILALQMLGVVKPEERAAALSYSLVVHFLQMVCTILPGMWFLWRRQVGLAELTRREDVETAE
jgi:hypothetical protein